jgi:hypothetical protein
MDNRCLITNCLPHYAVDYAHVLSRATGDDIVSSRRSELTIYSPQMQLNQLEFAWGLPWASLNVDTRFNVFRREYHIMIL